MDCELCGSIHDVIEAQLAEIRHVPASPSEVLPLGADSVGYIFDADGGISEKQAVIDALLEMLRQSATGDAGALARLLGQALAEAEKIVKEPV